MRIPRSLPFIVLAVIGTWMAGQAPNGRHSPTLGWETTVIGHNAEIVDLLPDIIGIAVGWLLLGPTTTQAIGDRQLP